MSRTHKAKPAITIIGSLNIDFVTTTPRVPGPGETLTATSHAVNAGGKGANQAVACGRAAFVSETEQDVDVRIIGAVGKADPYYESLLRPTLSGSGVDTRGVREIEGVGGTGTATILVDEGSHGENRILVVSGANDGGMRDLEQLIGVVRQQGQGEMPEVVVMQGEIPRATVLRLLEHFNPVEVKTRVIFNPAPVFPEGIPLDALKGLAVLVINETECLQLAKSLERVNAEVKDVDNMTPTELQQFANGFHQVARIKNVLITLGAKGVYYSAEDGKKQDLVAGVKVSNVVDTTAAGDTFVGYFATALARHIAQEDTKGDFDVALAVKQANEAAAKCVQRPGAMQSIPFGYE